LPAGFALISGGIAEFEPACTVLLERRPALPDYRSIHPTQGNS
jgi:hypothetical protein